MHRTQVPGKSFSHHLICFLSFQICSFLFSSIKVSQFPRFLAFPGFQKKREKNFDVISKQNQTLAEREREERTRERESKKLEKSTQGKLVSFCFAMINFSPEVERLMLGKICARRLNYESPQSRMKQNICCCCSQVYFFPQQVDCD